MLRPLPVLLAVLLATGTAACSRADRHDGGSDAPEAAGRQDARDWSALKDFDAVAVVGPDNVEVTIGTGFSVRAEGDAKIIQRLDIRQKNGTLSIGRRRGADSYWGDSGTATIHVTMPAIKAATLTGSGDFMLDRAEGTAFRLSLTGSGNAAIKAVQVGDLESGITGSGDVVLAGTADKARLSVTGSGDIDAEGLRVGQGDVNLLGSGDVGFASDGPVAISIMGSGDVTVKGKAQCRNSGMGSGEARCGG